MARLVESNKNTMTIELKAGQVVLDENGLEFEIEEGDSLMFVEKKKESEEEPKEDKDEKKKGKKESEDEESDDDKDKKKDDKESDDKKKDDKESEDKESEDDDKDEKKKKKESKNDVSYRGFTIRYNPMWGGAYSISPFHPELGASDTFSSVEDAKDFIDRAGSDFNPRWVNEKKKEKKNLTFLYTDSQLKEGSKNPYNKVNFESEFIGNNLQDVDMLLNDYDLDGHGVSPVIDNDGEIVGFVYDFDNDGYFNGHAIEDLGLFSHLDYFVYEL